MARANSLTVPTNVSAPSLGAVPQTLAFDTAAILLNTWLITGLFLDGWAHKHIPRLETFFTPWHAVLYSGFAVNGLFLLLALLRNRQRGHPWAQSLPPGYMLSLIGAIIFGVGGLLDLLWHLINGIERSLEALLSPTHLILALGGVLIVSGPLRSAWLTLPAAGRPRFTLTPALLSLAYIFSILTFFTQFADPIITSYANRATYDDLKALGIVSILLQTAFLMGVLLLALSRWRLPFGAITLIITVHGILSAFLARHTDFLAVALLSATIGILSDLLIHLLQPTPQRPAAFRAVAFAIPALAYVSGGLAWPINLWSGSIVMAGAVGLLLSFLVVPPTTPQALRLIP